MGKYDELTRGQTEALLNRIGGIEGMRGILSGELIVVRANGTTSVSGFVHDKTKDGWILLPESVSDSSVSAATNLELVSFLNRGESYISGEEMRTRAIRDNANFGQRQAEYLLEHQDEIPKEWREHYFVFPGTVWQDSIGRRDVPCLDWGSGRWSLSFRWLDVAWLAFGRLVRFSK